MADQVTNQKVRVIADTAQYKKEMAAAAKSTKQFKSDAKSALDEFASVFGVNLGGIRDSVDSVQNGFKAMSTGMRSSAASSGILSTALKALRVALISTGIGAIVVALGSLVAYFTRTERGAEGLQRVLAGIGAVINVLIDRFATFGEGVFKVLTGRFSEGWQILRASVTGIGAEMVKEAKAGYELEQALQAVEDREIALITVQAERRNKIEELRLKAKDLELTEKERLDALGQAIGIQKQMTADEISLQKERVRIEEAKYEMSEKTDDKLRSLQENRAKLNDIEAQSLSTIRGMSREYNSLAKSVAESNAQLEEEARLLEQRKLNALGPDGTELKEIKPLGITAKVGLELDTKTLATQLPKNLKDAQAVIIDFSKAINDSFSSAAESFGQFLGELMSGSASVKDLGSFLLGAIADMAIQLGRLAIATGIATIGIKKALQSMNGYVAIAAGVALVALGSMVKGTMSRMANSGGGGGTYSNNANVYDTRTADYAPGAFVRQQPIAVTVTGEFKQRGKDLVAVISETNYRSGYSK